MDLVLIKPILVTNQNEFAGSDQLYTGRPVYKYYRSFEGSNSREARAVIDDDSTKVLYAETPYSEYVNSFFTDQELTQLYIPGNVNNNPYINFSYAHDHEQTGNAVRWVNPSNYGQNANIRMVAGFNDIGVKIKTTETAFLHAKLTTYTALGEVCDGNFPPTRFYNNI